MGTFFFHFAQKINLGQKFQYFLTRKKEDNAAVGLATISATRWTGNKLFLRVALLNNLDFMDRILGWIMSNNVQI